MFIKALLAAGFRLLFRLPALRGTYFGFYQRVFAPWQLFDGVRKTVRYGPGLRLHLRLEDWIQQNIYFLGGYEEPGQRFLERYLRPGDVFIDVGANIGLYALAAARRVGPRGRVHAFEPVPDTAARLRQHVALNELANITVVEMAVSNAPGPVAIYLPPASNSGMASLYAYTAELHALATVSATTLDAYTAGWAAVRLVKLDIEGAEWQALQGMARLLATQRPALLLELEPGILAQMEHSAAGIAQWLAGFGYRPHYVQADGSLGTHAAPATGFNNVVFLPPTGP
ncbi:FkbM family methyltransferase [Hymenobacter caeli]|uniref:FkbM family methyltransferase n=1 Tax=Hymenobacter caeli TaxID=2735894 RepID=A0ABX2FXK0_9BACT|nr:FkbM family methyltransferase [Hymenobacter caeli]NRT21095.1 FkbM family methyltransferase [Hymenobacter caeli]